MKEKKRVGIVTTWFERGAAYVSRQYKALLEEDYDVFIFARGGEEYAIGDPKWDGPNVTWATPCRIQVTMSINLDEFVHWIKANRLDIVFFNEQHWWPAVLAANETGAITGSYVDYYTEETVPFFQSFDFLICNTQRHFSVFKDHPGARYIPWGTDISLFTPRSTELVDPEHVTFFHSGGVSPHRKGCDAVIEAFSRLTGPCSLVIHAQRDLKKYFPSLAGKIEDLERSGRLVCHEKTVSAPGLFHLGDVYVYPTRLEGIGLTIMEAAACGLPVIVTDTGPMNEFVTDGENGSLVKVERFERRSDNYYWPQAFCDLDDLTAKMQWYVDHMGEVGAMKERARAVAASRFDWGKQQSIICQAFMDASKKPESAALNKAIRDFESRRGGLKAPSAIYTRFHDWAYKKHPRFFNFCSGIMSALKSMKPGVNAS
jgi:glycosyltransferase involved in cell wall biosynthesis